MKDWKTKAENILKSDEGRAELERLLGGKIVSKEQPEELPIVAALVPCYDHPEPQMQEAFIKMQNASREHCVLFPGPPVSSSVIHWSRNWLIAELIKTGRPWTHVLFIDDDIVPPEDALIKMLAAKKDIVAALCTRRTDPPIPNIRDYDEKSGSYREIWAWKKNAVVEVGAAGTGMMLISREALNKVGDAFWRCAYERDIYGMPEEKALQIQEARLKLFDETANAYWFRFLPCPAGTFEMGEDVSFCHVARAYCGIPTYCDTSIQPGHIGSYVYSIQDFLPHQKLALLRANAEKQFKKTDSDDAVITVMIPTRGRREELQASISSLLSNASNPASVEILIRIDDDERYNDYYVGEPQQIRVLQGERHGYRHLHRYYNEMAAQAQGEWLMLWNDDAYMEEPEWDKKIRNAGSGLQVLNPTGNLNVFPIIHKSVYELLGHISQQAHTDTWIQEVSRAAQIERYLPLKIKHDPKPEQYSETRPEFYSEPMQKLMISDAEKIARTLMEHV